MRSLTLHLQSVGYIGRFTSSGKSVKSEEITPANAVRGYFQTMADGSYSNYTAGGSELYFTKDQTWRSLGLGYLGIGSSCWDIPGRDIDECQPWQIRAELIMLLS